MEFKVKAIKEISEEKEGKEGNETTEKYLHTGVSTEKDAEIVVMIKAAKPLYKIGDVFDVKIKEIQTTLEAKK